MGRFLGVMPPTQPHRCEIVSFHTSMPTYTVWECECGKAYRLEEISEHNETFRQWTRYPAADANDGQRR